MTPSTPDRRDESQAAKAESFQALHAKGTCFVIPNPWDAGSAKLLTTMGFEALATTSAGLAIRLGQPDGEMAITPDQAFDNAREIVQATALPVSGDLENGWSETPEGVAKAVERAVEVGLVGGSIEDVKPGAESSIYELGHAVERIEAAVEASRAAPFPFVLTARSDGYLHGRPFLDETIRRLQAFHEAGAGALYAPGLRSLDDIATLVAAVDAPVNVLMGLTGAPCSVRDLAAVGVTRISLGSSLARAAFGTLRRGAEEVLGPGTFSFARGALPLTELNALFRQE